MYRGLSLLQDEFAFYLEDAKSSLLLVPANGNTNAEQAAAKLGVPVVAISSSYRNGISTPSYILPGIEHILGLQWVRSATSDSFTPCHQCFNGLHACLIWKLQQLGIIQR